VRAPGSGGSGTLGKLVIRAITRAVAALGCAVSALGLGGAGALRSEPASGAHTAEGLRLAGSCSPSGDSAHPTQTDWEVRRAELIREIDREMRGTARFTGRAKLAPAVRAALTQVPREAFVREEDETRAYINRPLAIGHGQTISQPFIVALMTDLVDPEPDDKVLEIGTGSGYQAAVLSQLVDRVYSVEVIPALASSAAARLEGLGYRNVRVRTGDGNLGWPEHAPYDGILVTAAAPAIPPALVEQLGPGARMVIPVGGSRYEQNLMVVEKSTAGVVTEREVLPVAFVPLVEGRPQSEGASAPEP
jgi:protein-L-isoaspartate(D-aspartate) O-methyltransferase